MKRAVGVVGIGRWGATIVQNLHDHPRCGPVTAFDPQSDRIEYARRRWAGIGISASVESLLDEETVEALVVCTPMPTHAQLALAALNAGKHVLVEKPMTTRLEDAQRLVDEAEKRQRVLMVGHTPQYAPAAAAVRRVVLSGSLGTPIHGRAIRWNAQGPAKAPPALWDLAVHDIALMLDWLASTTSDPLGPVDVAQVAIAPQRAQATFFLGPHTVQIDAGHGERRRCISLEGPKGRVTWSSDPDDVVQLETEQSTRRLPLETRTPLHLQLDAFFSAVEAGVRPHSNGQHGLRVISILTQLENVAAARSF